MIGCDLGQALLFAAMATLPSFGVLVALLATTTLLQSAYGPAAPPPYRSWSRRAS